MRIIFREVLTSLKSKKININYVLCRVPLGEGSRTDGAGRVLCGKFAFRMR